MPRSDCYFAYHHAEGGFMKKRTIAVLLSICFAFAITGIAADRQNRFSHLMWIIKGDQQEQSIDKEQAARIYVDACQWIEDRFGADGRTIRPHLTVHVGESCPDPGLTGACLS